MLFCFYVGASFISFAAAELITLLKENNVTCVVSGETINSPVYVQPPTKSGINKTIKKIDTWLIDDWQKINSVDSYQNVVVDKRWEDFMIIDQDTGYALKNNSLPFSICLSESTVFTVFSSDFRNEKEEPFKLHKNVSRKSNACTWLHYTFVKNGTTVQSISEDNVVESYKIGFDPFWVYFGDSFAENRIFWKLHSYDFRVAKIPTQDERSTVSVTLAENLCLSMYVSIDKDSYLDVTLQSKSKSYNKTIIGFNEPNSLKIWQTFEIEAEDSGQYNITFSRGQIQPGKNGYWAIDKIAFCQKSPEVYEVSFEHGLQPEERTCELLNESNELPKRNILSCDKPGFLGENCNISCSTVLGPSYPFCNGYRICPQALTCFCSWGYQGPNCDKPCERGTWGLFCKNRCDKSQCPQNCHPATGECFQEMEYYHSDTITPATEDGPKWERIGPDQVRFSFPKLEHKNNSIMFLCANEWCYDRIIKREIIPDSEVFFIDVQTVLPITEYKVVVETLLSNKTIRKTYGVLTHDAFFFGVTDFSFYSSNSSTLWVRFRNPSLLNTKSPAYKVWYYQQHSMLEATNFVTASHCCLWEGFICAKIDNLTKDTNYSIIVEAMETQYQKWGLSETFTGFTAEKAPEAVQNLEMTWSSNFEAILKWDQPFITNGPLKKFVVSVQTDEEITKHTTNVSDLQKTHSYKLPLNYNCSYTISVRAVNAFESARNEIRVRFIDINSKQFADDVLMEVCSTKCYWLVPLPKLLEGNRFKTSLIVGTPENETDDDIINYVKTKKQFENNRNRWITLEDTDVIDTFCSVDLSPDELQQLKSLETNKMYSLYYVVNDTTTNNYLVYPIRGEMKRNWFPGLKFATSTVVIFAIAIILTLLLVTLMLLQLLRFRRTKNSLQDANLLEECELISHNNHDNNTKIPTIHLEQFLKSHLHTGKELFIVPFKSVAAVTKSTVHALRNRNRNKNKGNKYVPCKLL